ncbi:MAG: ATP synthase subunit I [Candidatus Latescibacter sp.]|nr:ATP synthase subunit I [Candidatus Latescibacter sp.]
MNEFFGLFLALIFGLALGFVHLGILRLTVEQLSRSNRPSMLFLGGFIVRMGISLLIFLAAVWIASWPGVIVSLAGFLLVRTILTHRWGPQKAERKENCHGNQS